jgi:hypothetical protein
MAEQEQELKERRRNDHLYYNFLEPLELFFYQTLRARYPEMTVADIAVCRDVFIHLTSIDIDGEYGDVVERMQIWTLRTIPREEWARYVFENKHRVLEGNDRDKCDSVEWAEENKIQKLIDKHGLDKASSYPLYQNKSSITEAVGLARGRNYIRYELYETNHNIDYWDPQSPNSKIVLLPNARVRLRQDIYDTLNQSIEDAVVTPNYVSDEVLEKHEAELAELEISRHHAG